MDCFAPLAMMGICTQLVAFAWLTSVGFAV